MFYQNKNNYFVICEIDNIHFTVHFFKHYQQPLSFGNKISGKYFETLGAIVR